MDTQILIKKLNEVFCDYNKSHGKKYSQVWLSEVDFGGLYNNGSYNLCVKANHQIDSCLDETTEVIQFLGEKAKNELELLWTIQIYDAEDQIHCQSEDLKVYTEADAC